MYVAQCWRVWYSYMCDNHQSQLITLQTHATNVACCISVLHTTHSHSSAVYTPSAWISSICVFWTSKTAVNYITIWKINSLSLYISRSSKTANNDKVYRIASSTLRVIIQQSDINKVINTLLLKLTWHFVKNYRSRMVIKNHNTYRISFFSFHPFWIPGL